MVDTEALINKPRNGPERANWIIAMVRIDPESLDTQAERIDISLPSRVLHAIDRAAAEGHKTRSGFLAEAALAMASHHWKALAGWPGSVSSMPLTSIRQARRRPS